MNLLINKIMNWIDKFNLYVIHVSVNLWMHEMNQWMNVFINGWMDHGWLNELMKSGNVMSVKGEVRSWSYLISEERVKFSEQNWKPDENRLKNKEVMTFWNFANFQETFLDQSVWICKWVSWWCHRLTIFHSFCTQKWQKFHISAMRMLDLP